MLAGYWIFPLNPPNSVLSHPYLTPHEDVVGLSAFLGDFMGTKNINGLSRENYQVESLKRRKWQKTIFALVLKP